jgi:UDP-2,4-diacetamido-2,4,6-trideoxy-beta-L-altropyranose hydrolase
MRCLTLANALRDRGAETRVVSAEIPSSVRALATSQGHELHVLSGQSSLGAHRGLGMPLGGNQDRDAEETVAALGARSWDWVVVDHYLLDSRWEKSLRRAARKILVIDDLADRPHDCDVLLDQNLHDGMEGRYSGMLSSGALQLLGPRYALLRPCFRELRQFAKPRSDLRRVLLLFGGTDPVNLTGRALEALDCSEGRDLSVDVIIGAEHACRMQIETICERAGHRCHVQPPDVATLMSEADLSIGAGGSTSWERCCLGLPSICASVAENQRGIARALQSAGASVYLGDADEATAASIRSELGRLRSDHARLTSMSIRALSLVDGGGVERVLDAMGRE